MSPPPTDDGEARGWLQIATQIAGLLAGFITLVYLTGAVVTALRLEFKNLGWDNVISQLPREFLISIGLAQVLLPALLVGALYGFIRLLKADRDGPPVLHRFFHEGGKARIGALGGYARTLAVLAIPPVLFLVLRVPSDDLGIKKSLVVAVAAVLLSFVAIAVHETRAVVLARPRSVHRWNSLGAVVAVAALYAAAMIPSMMVAAAGVPLTTAKVCTVDNFYEHGYLVGQTSDRVYLGEKGDKRRIAVIPMSKVEEVFIGDDIGNDDEGALCEIVSALPTASERREIEATMRDEPRMNSLLTPDR